MKVKKEYDKTMPVMAESHSLYLADLVDFINGGHKAVRLEYENAKMAIAVSKSMYGFLSRHRIYDIYLSRRSNIIHLMRREEDENGK